MGRKPLPENCCGDCGIYALKDLKDYFMVTPQLWDEFGNGHGLLCLNCFRKRIQRKFKKDDFTDAPINKVNPFINEL